MQYFNYLPQAQYWESNIKKNKYKKQCCKFPSLHHRWTSYKFLVDRAFFLDWTRCEGDKLSHSWRKIIQLATCFYVPTHTKEVTSETGSFHSNMAIHSVDYNSTYLWHPFDNSTKAICKSIIFLLYIMRTVHFWHLEPRCHFW